ncbi:hypothetical protein ACFE04_027320 [Oxalis oulophora]
MENKEEACRGKEITNDPLNLARSLGVECEVIALAFEVLHINNPSPLLGDTLDHPIVIGDTPKATPTFNATYYTLNPSINVSTSLECEPIEDSISLGVCVTEPSVESDPIENDTLVEEETSEESNDSTNTSSIDLEELSELVLSSCGIYNIKLVS